MGDITLQEFVALMCFKVTEEVWDIVGHVLEGMFTPERAPPLQSNRFLCVVIPYAWIQRSTPRGARYDHLWA